MAYGMTSMGGIGALSAGTDIPEGGRESVDKVV